jgi:hypothetical protein
MYHFYDFANRYTASYKSLKFFDPHKFSAVIQI